MEPVTVSQIAEFIQVVANAFSDTLFYSFTLLIALSVCYGVKRIAVDV